MELSWFSKVWNLIGVLILINLSLNAGNYKRILFFQIYLKICSLINKNGYNKYYTNRNMFYEFPMNLKVISQVKMNVLGNLLNTGIKMSHCLFRKKYLNY